MYIRLAHIFFLFAFLNINTINAQIVNIEDKRSIFSSDTILWNESLDLGFNLYKYDDFVMAINGAIQLEFQYKNKLLLSITKMKLIKAAEDRFINQGFQHLRYNVRWSPDLVFELFGQVQYNEQGNIKLRALLGSGLRLRLMEKGSQRMFLGLSGMYEKEDESKVDTEHNDFRMSSYLTLSVRPFKTVHIASTTYYQPLFENFYDMRVSTETSIFLDISEKLAWTVTYSYTRDRKPPFGAPPASYSISNGIRFRF